jgi:hypothetical protein
MAKTVADQFAATISSISPDRTCGREGRSERTVANLDMTISGIA